MARADSPTRVVRDCPVCRAPTAHQVLYEKWGHPIVACAGCGLGSSFLLAPDPSPSIYDEAYFNGGRNDGYADYAGSETVLRTEFRRSMALLLSQTGAGGRLLEIGCAYGFFLLEAHSHFECKGVDISEAASLACLARGLDVTRGSATPSFLRTEGPFDIVVMLDVIEHLDRPAELLESLWETMPVGATVMITTGDWSSPVARAFGRHWRLMTPPQHVWFFTRGTLLELLRRIGFQVVHCSRPSKVVPLGLVLHQLSRGLGQRLAIWKRLDRLGLPVNLFDTLRIIARKRSG